MKSLFRALLVALTVVTLQSAQSAQSPRVQGRSMVISRTGIAATEQVLASQAAAKILADGGTAADAAVAANAVMGLVSPGMCGIGGDMFCLVYEARSGKVYGLNASGWSPEKLTADFLKSKGITVMPTNGIHSVTVPGTVEGWVKLLDRFGKKKLRDVLKPAIQLAEEGFPVTEWVVDYWKTDAPKLAQTDSAARTFLQNGKAPAVGDIFRNPDLAWSYRQIARRGRKAFYDGVITDRLLKFSESVGGTFSRDDFRKFEARWVEPISTTYRGWRVYEIPPNGQGIAVLSMLNIMEQFPMAEYGDNSAQALHVIIEAKKLAYADMLKYVADPDFSKIPVREMLSKKHAAARAKLITDTANCAVPATITFEAGPETTYFCVVDSEGNMVSYIQSNYYAFGSKLVPDGCGFALQNRAGLFSLEPNHPNVLTGRKRPLHTIIPAFMEKDGVGIAFGIMGGWNQAQAHAQFVSKIVDHNLNIQAAMESPRITKLTFEGCDVKLESRIPQAVGLELERRGHKVQALPPYSTDVGGGQAVMRDFRIRVNTGASDPRKDGAAVMEMW
jgi:gamma-glutamyltranspeptidase/glutathione hydrolase